MRAVYSYVMKRARTDKAFRHSLLFEPKQALEEEFDISLPEYFNIRFIEKNGADITIVLPDLETHETLLGEYDLGYVAGGNSTNDNASDSKRSGEYTYDIFSRLFNALPTHGNA